LGTNCQGSLDNQDQPHPQGGAEGEIAQDQPNAGTSEQEVDGD